MFRNGKANHCCLPIAAVTMDGMEHRPAGVLPVELTDSPIYEMSSETKHIDVLFAVG